MRALLQRVTSASVSIDGAETGSIGPGLVVLLGVADGDDDADARYLVDKVANLRIFADEQGRFNHSALDVGAGLLLVSQFTLYADTRRGRRPDFTRAADPETASSLYQQAVEMFRATGLPVATGEFQAYMQVKLGKRRPGNHPAGQRRPRPPETVIAPAIGASPSPCTSPAGRQSVPRGTRSPRSSAPARRPRCAAPTPAE